MKFATGAEVLERPAPANEVRVNVEAGFKTILFHVHDDDAVMDRLQAALAIARAFAAHLRCIHVIPIEAYSVVDTYGGTFVSGEIVEAFEQEANDLRMSIEQLLRKEDVSWTYETVTGDVATTLIQRASLADLVIAVREPRQLHYGGDTVTLLGDLLAQVRTPVLIIGDGQPHFDPFGPAVIAWNGSYEAANAVRMAVPLLRLASTVSVIAFSEEARTMFPSTDLVHYLSRHGIPAELEVQTAPAAGLSFALTGYAQRKGAAYMVMGGYSHSRAGEFLFGGVTRTLLKSCQIPLLVAR